MTGQGGTGQGTDWTPTSPSLTQLTALRHPSNNTLMICTSVCVGRRKLQLLVFIFLQADHQLIAGRVAQGPAINQATPYLDKVLGLKNMEVGR
jgi:hypothetical protein